LLPGKDLADGLRVITSNVDTNLMVSVVEKVKNLVVYVDHHDNLLSVDWDDIVANPMNELPKVLSRHKDVPSQQPDDEDGSGSEVELMDSDNEICGGDDDLMEDAIHFEVKQVKSNKKAKGSQLKALVISRPPLVNEETDTEDEGLELPESDGEGKKKLRFNSWNPEDLSNPTFFVGLVFPSIEKLREAITEYSVKNRVEIKLPRNDQRRVRAHCAAGCPWNLYAPLDSRVKSFVVKTYYGSHNCHKEWVLKRCTSKWLAEKYNDYFQSK
jgi:hypothetical protein